MKKILLDLNLIKNREQLHDYLALTMDFPDYYGRNLDALYDMLTDIMEDTCIGIFCGDREDIPAVHLERVKKVFKDAEEDNPHLCVIFSELEENYEQELVNECYSSRGGQEDEPHEQ